MATIWRPLPPPQLGFATGLYLTGRAQDPGCVSLGAARAEKAGVQRAARLNRGRRAH